MNTESKEDGLSIFLSMDESSVKNDLADVEENFEQRNNRLKEYRSISYSSRTPAQTADYYHNLMLQAFFLNEHSPVPVDLRLCNADMAVETIAEEAVMNSLSTSESLLKLEAKIKAMREHEGLEDDEYWPIGEGPEDYEGLSEESEKIIDQIRSFVKAHVFHRYSLSEFADLYESDRMKYEVMREAGRRVLFAEKEGASDMIPTIEGILSKKHGQEALVLLSERLQTIQRIMN